MPKVGASSYLAYRNGCWLPGASVRAYLFWQHVAALALPAVVRLGLRGTGAAQHHPQPALLAFLRKAVAQALVPRGVGLCVALHAVGAGAMW